MARVADKREEFGDQWPRVVSIMRTLERMGIQLTDIHPANIALGDPPPT